MYLIATSVLLRSSELFLPVIIPSAFLRGTSYADFLTVGVLQKWRQERLKLGDAFVAAGHRPSDGSMGPSLRGHSSLVCQRIIVMNKRDLVADWGIKVTSLYRNEQQVPDVFGCVRFR